MLTARPSRAALVLTGATPLLGLAVLAGVDAATGGNSHFLRTVVHAQGAGAIGDLLIRRYSVAGHTLLAGFEPLLTAIALLLGAYAFRFRERLYAAAGEPWRAFLGGGFAAAVACSIFNDSGPNPLILGVGVLALLSAYLRCPPPRPCGGGPAAGSGASG